jgi:hypothetical protein
MNEKQQSKYYFILGFIFLLIIAILFVTVRISRKKLQTELNKNGRYTIGVSDKDKIRINRATDIFVIKYFINNKSYITEGSVFSRGYREVDFFIVKFSSENPEKSIVIFANPDIVLDTLNPPVNGWDSSQFKNIFIETGIIDNVYLESP